MLGTFETERTKRDALKTVVALVAGAYFLWAAVHPADWRMIDGFNLVMHEAGHVLFMFFGEFMTIAGGSLFQVLVPAIFAGYFCYHKKDFSSALMLFMVGESLLNVSVYAGDAVRMQLPLLGGDDSIHDWNYLLEHAGLLGHTALIAGLLRASGTLIIIFATFRAFTTARHEKESYA
jgi:hypothetical protein